MKKVLLFALACIMVFGLFAGCTPSIPSGENSAPPADNSPEAPGDGIKRGGTFIASIPGDPSMYNPCLAMDEAAGFVNFQLFNALVFMDADQNIAPDLAVDWAFNDDYTELTFKLREGVKWHDGEPFTSADVKWTYDTIISEAGTLSSNLANVAEITAPDEYTVVFKLSAPQATLVYYLAWFGGEILPKHIYEGTDWLTNPANQNPIGTGPFKFVSAQSGVSVELEANPDYFGEGPYVDKIIFQIIPDHQTEYQMWQNGEIDYGYFGIVTTDFAKYDNDPAYSSRFSIMPNRNYFTFNFAKEDNPFLDVRLRQAFDLALNREQILTTGLNGNGAVAEYYISPVFSWALNEDAKIPAQNIEEAKRLLEEAGYTADANGIYISVTVDVFSGFEDTLIIAQANLREAGIDMQINTLEQNAWMEKIFSGSYDVTLLGGDQGPDISSIGNRVGTGGMVNVAFYSNPELDELLARGEATANQAERAPIYRQIQAIMAEDLPMVICNEVGVKAVVRSNIHGVPLVDDTVRNMVRRYSLELVWIGD